MHELPPAVTGGWLANLKVDLRSVPPPSWGASTQRTVANAGRVLRGERAGWRAVFPFAGPAIIASVAYIDPGNFATNIQAGAADGYTLLWVVVLANLIAMLLQSLSARVGIVTGRNLAELSREYFSRPVVWAMWIGSEIAAMATDLAEFLGGALGLSILLRIPLFTGMLLTAVITYLILGLQRRGFRPLELLIAALVAVVGLSYLMEVVIAPLSWGKAALDSIVPHLDNAKAVTLAVGILGATVMPHAIYLHSGLTQNRVPAEGDRQRQQLVRFSNYEILVALGFAGLINMAMLAMAAAVFHDGRHNDIADISTAYETLKPLLGGGAAVVFMLSLIASGLSSSAVGTMAGQVIMQGFINIHIPIWIRRLVTMAPAFVVVALGANLTQALVMSQVILSLALPIPMISLVMLTCRRDVMGAFVNSRLTATVAIIATVVVLALNGLLLVQFAGLV